MMYRTFNKQEYIEGALVLAGFVVGLIIDCIIGIRLLSGGPLLLFLLHLPAALIWAWGVNAITILRAHGQPRITGWGLTALFLGLATFPGFGSCACTIALLCAYSIPSRSVVTALEATNTLSLSALPIELSPSLDWLAQPHIDTLSDPELETRRITVASLAQSTMPGAAQLLRQLLLDPQPEIRSDASIALVRLEDGLARTLNLSFQRWLAEPTNLEHSLTLIDQYYLYATSNVLDQDSQSLYLAKARDLLLQVLARDSQNAYLWLKLARIRQNLGEVAQALQDSRHALELHPSFPEASQLAMELAFRLRSWHTFTELLAEKTTPVPTSLQSFSRWSNPRSESEALHG